MYTGTTSALRSSTLTGIPNDEKSVGRVDESAAGNALAAKDKMKQKTFV